jgi:hypothetical protein
MFLYNHLFLLTVTTMSCNSQAHSSEFYKEHLKIYEAQRLWLSRSIVALVSLLSKSSTINLDGHSGNVIYKQRLFCMVLAAHLTEGINFWAFIYIVVRLTGKTEYMWVTENKSKHGYQAVFKRFHWIIFHISSPWCFWFYSFLLSEWSAIEKELGDGLQSAGHHMDVWVREERELNVTWGDSVLGTPPFFCFYQV